MRGGIWIAVVVATGSIAAADPDPVATAARAQVGSYHCRGKVIDGDDATHTVTARVVVSLELDGHWLVWRLTQDRSRIIRRPLRFVIHRGFDAATSSWHAVQLDSTGGRAELASTDGSTWTGTLVVGAISVAIRDHQELTGKALHLWGDYEVEPGLFDPAYDMTCRRGT